MTEQTLKCEEVSASFLDRLGRLQRAAGKVTRNDSGELVIESWADGGKEGSSAEFVGGIVKAMC